jgi:hypothetical protein
MDCPECGKPCIMLFDGHQCAKCWGKAGQYGGATRADTEPWTGMGKDWLSHAYVPPIEGYNPKPIKPLFDLDGFCSAIEGGEGPVTWGRK